MLKAMYMNDCQCDFIDNQGQLIFSFESCNRITSLDIRKLQLASMIKGAWCKSFEEVSYYLSFLHYLKPNEIGKIVHFFKLFDSNSEKLISDLPNNVWVLISFITFRKSNLSCFFISDFEKKDITTRPAEKDTILLQPIKSFYRFWRSLKWENINCVGDLTNLTKTELMSIRNIGPARADEIEKLLSEKGLHLKEENE